MKAWKIISGIFSLIGALLAALVDGIVSAAQTSFGYNDNMGAITVFALIFYFAAGIVSLATCKSKHLSNIATFIMFAPAAVLLLLQARMYEYNYVFGVWCAICAIIAFVFIFIPDKVVEPVRYAPQNGQYYVPQPQNVQYYPPQQNVQNGQYYAPPQPNVQNGQYYQPPQQGGQYYPTQQNGRP